MNFLSLRLCLWPILRFIRSGLFDRLLRFVIIRLLIVIYSVRTRSVTVVFAVLPFAVVLPDSAVTVAVSVSVPVSFAVFIFVAGVAVRFFSVER